MNILIAFAHLSPQHGIIRKPFNDGAVLWQPFDLVGDPPLLLTAIVHDRRTYDRRLPIRTPRRAAAQEDHRDCEDD